MHNFLGMITAIFARATVKTGFYSIVSHFQDMTYEMERWQLCRRYDSFVFVPKASQINREYTDEAKGSSCCLEIKGAFFFTQEQLFGSAGLRNSFM